MRRTNQAVEGIQSIMDAQTLERLSSELVRLCDSIEKHGLVDYQMGVAEEEIMECTLSLLVEYDNERSANYMLSTAPVPVFPQSGQWKNDRNDERRIQRRRISQAVNTRSPALL